MSNRPKVSVVTITYNHEKYIREALESFVGQKTDFEFEVVVADDCSTDKTQDIIREYAKLYPNIIKPILRKKNVGAQNNSIDSLRAATGTYIALCEGDDFWTDPEKLQKQVDFLDKNPGYGLCFHTVRVFYENHEEPDSIFPDVSERATFTVQGLLQRNFIQTNAVMYRRQSYDSLPNTVLPLDWYLHLYHAQFGKIGFINRTMSAYRRHAGGLWWESSNNLDEIWRKYGLAHLALFVEMLKLYGKKPAYAQIIYASIYKMFDNLVSADAKYHERLVTRASLAYPEAAAAFIAYQYQVRGEQEAAIRKKAKDIEKLHRAVREAKEHGDWLERTKNQELAAIKASRFWKLRNIVARMLGKRAI